MSKVMVRYKVKADQVQENERLIGAVYEELDRAEPSGLRYATFRLDDGVSFVHIAANESGGEQTPLLEIAAFREFLADIGERCAEPPVTVKLQEIGSFRFWQ